MIPTPQFIRGRQIAQPLVDRSLLLGQAPRPEPVYQDTHAIAAFCGFVYSFDRDRHEYENLVCTIIVKRFAARRLADWAIGRRLSKSGTVENRSLQFFITDRNFSGRFVVERCL